MANTCFSNPKEDCSIRNRPSNLPIWGFLLMLTLVLAASIVLLIIWVSVFPKPFDMEVEDMTASYYYFTASKHLNAMFDVTLGFNNPNRILTIYYFWLNVTIERDNQTLAFHEYTDPIVQHPRNLTIFHGRMKTINVKPQNEQTLMDLQPASSGEIIVDVRINMRIQLWTKYWESKRHSIETICSNVRVHRRKSTFTGSTAWGKKHRKNRKDALSVPEPGKQCRVYL